MIDYSAAGFTLLQERICMRRKIGEFAMSSSLTANYCRCQQHPF